MPTQNNALLPPMQVYSAGVVTSIGMSLDASYAALNAGLDNFQETSFANRGVPVIGAAIEPSAHPAIAKPNARGHERLANFVRMAIEECLINANLEVPCALKVPILLVLGETDRYGRSDKLASACQSAYASLLKNASQTPFFKAEVGSVGTLEALKAAAKIISEGEYSSVLLVGVDSWLNTPDIQYAIGRDRLLSSENACGFIPSEGAAAVLLSAPNALDSKPNGCPDNVPLYIAGLGQGQESASLYTDEPCYGTGLSKAMRSALEQAETALHHVQLELTDITSEAYFFDEIAYARTRLLRQSMPQGFRRIHPSSCMGNTGAACGATLLALAWKESQINQKTSPTLISLSASSEARGAIVLKRKEDL